MVDKIRTKVESRSSKIFIRWLATVFPGVLTSPDRFLQVGEDESWPYAAVLTQCQVLTL